MRAGFALLIFFGLVAVLVALLSGDGTVAAALATALIGVFSVVYQQDRQKRLDLERAHRDEMVPFYEGFIDRVRDFSDVAATEQPGQDLVAFMGDFQTKLLLRAPALIIDAWVTTTRVAIPDDPTDPTAVLAYERLLRAIRKDLGHEDMLLKEGDLLRIFVDDIDDNLPPRGERWSPPSGS